MRGAAPLLVAIAACGVDRLGTPPEQQVPSGALSGRLCDRERGRWLAGALVRVAGSDRAVTAGGDGDFHIDELPVGRYDLEITAESYVGRRNGTVHAGRTTDIGVDRCETEHGHIEGRVCDPRSDAWLAGGTATLGARSEPIDPQGRFRFADAPIGSHTITVVSGDFTAELPASVLPFNTVHIGDLACGPAGGLRGRICGGGGYWLAGARVSVVLSDGARFETSTDGQGFFSLSDLPAGTHRVEVRRGSFYASFEATVTGGVTTTLPDPVCMPPTTRIAVVTGIYDSIEVVLEGLGNRVGTLHSYDGEQVGHPDGNIDIYDGAGDFWITDFLADASRLREYRILFFNCGLSDWALAGGGSQAQRALDNLVDFVASGGSVYASDWASELLALAFPLRIAFFGAGDYGARVGVEDTALTATVLDPGMQAALGRTQVLLRLDLGNWVVLASEQQQPASLRQHVVADVRVYDDDLRTSPHNGAPLLVTFQHGAGRVLYTSFHNEQQTTEDMDALLQYAVFEL